MKIPVVVLSSEHASKPGHVKMVMGQANHTGRPTSALTVTTWQSSGCADLGNGKDKGLDGFKVLEPVFGKLDSIPERIAKLQIPPWICRCHPHRGS